MAEDSNHQTDVDAEYAFASDFVVCVMRRHFQNWQAYYACHYSLDITRYFTPELEKAVLLIANEMESMIEDMFLQDFSKYTYSLDVYRNTVEKVKSTFEEKGYSDRRFIRYCLGVSEYAKFMYMRHIVYAPDDAIYYIFSIIAAFRKSKDLTINTWSNIEKSAVEMCAQL